MKNLEIENKYLLSYDKALTFLKSLQNYNTKKIVQSYIKYSKNSIKRVRKIGNKYILTFKKGNGRVRVEKEKFITKKRYKKLSKKKIGKKIKKIRYFFTIKDKNYELDIFKGKFKNLAFLEIEFKDEKEMKSFSLPNILSKIVIKDVSEDIKYTNSSLALLSSVPNIEKIFNNINSLDIDKKFVFRYAKNISIYNYLRIYLYYYFTLLNRYSRLTVDGNNDEDLHQFRVNTRRIRSILSLHKELFDEKIYKKVKLSFKKIVSQTNKKRDIDVFLKKLKNFDIEDYNIKKFICFLENKAKYENNQIKNLLSSKEFLEILFDFEILLKDDNAFFSTNIANIPAKQYSKFKNKKILKNINISLKKLNHKVSIQKFHNVRIKIKKFNYFMETFYPLVKNKKNKKIKKSLKRYQTLFGKLNDIYNQINILRYYCDTNNISAIDMFLPSLKDELKNIKQKIINYGSKSSIY